MNTQLKLLSLLRDCNGILINARSLRSQLQIEFRTPLSEGEITTHMDQLERKSPPQVVIVNNPDLGQRYRITDDGLARLAAAGL